MYQTVTFPVYAALHWSCQDTARASFPSRWSCLRMQSSLSRTTVLLSCAYVMRCTSAWRHVSVWRALLHSWRPASPRLAPTLTKSSNITSLETGEWFGYSDALYFKIGSVLQNGLFQTRTESSSLTSSASSSLAHFSSSALYSGFSFIFQLFHTLTIHAAFYSYQCFLFHPRM